MARRLSEIADQLEPTVVTPGPDRLHELGHGAFARALIESRREIGRFFPEELFADPARDLLLELFIAAESGNRTPVSSACIAAAVPATTALRWLVNLKGRELIVYKDDPMDKRRSFVELTPDAIQQVRAYLASVSARLSRASPRPSARL